MQEVVRAANVSAPFESGRSRRGRRRRRSGRQEVAVARVLDRIRIGIGHLPPVAVEVRDRHEQLQQVPVGHQRRRAGRRRAVLVHACGRRRRSTAPSGRRGAALASAPCSATQTPSSMRVGSHRGAASRPSMSPRSNQRSRKLVLRQVVRERLREADAVDPAGRGAGDHVDDHARPAGARGLAARQLCRAAGRRRARSAWPPSPSPDSSRAEPLTSRWSSFVTPCM